MTFTSDFKKEVVRTYCEEGKTEQMIFAKAGIPLAIIGSAVPQECIRRWYSKTAEELTQDGRGKHDSVRGRPRKEKVDPARMTIPEQLEYYKAKSVFDNLKLAFLARA